MAQALDRVLTSYRIGDPRGTHLRCDRIDAASGPLEHSSKSDDLHVGALLDRDAREASPRQPASHRPTSTASRRRRVELLITERMFDDPTERADYLVVGATAETSAVARPAWRFRP